MLLRNSTCRYLPKSTENIRPNETSYANVHSSILYNSQKVEPLWNTHWLAKGQWDYSNIKKNQVLINANTCMNQRNIMLVDKSQNQKATCWFYLYGMCRKVDVQRQRNDAPLPQCEPFKDERAQDNMAMVRREPGGWPFWNMTGEGTEKQLTQASLAPHSFIVGFRWFCTLSVIARKCNEIENFISP